MTEMIVPLTLGFGGPVIGTAVVKEDGTFTAKLNDSKFVGSLFYLGERDLVDNISISAYSKPMKPTLVDETTMDLIKNYRRST